MTLKDAVQIIPFILTLLLIFLFGFQLLSGEPTFIQEFIRSYNYLAAIVLAFFSGFILTVPVPASVWINYYLEAGLEYFPLLLVIVIAQTAADLTSLLFASFIRKNVKERSARFITSVRKLRDRSKNMPLLLFFLWAVCVPLPNEIMGYTMVFLGYPLRVLIPILFVGNIAFNILIMSGILLIS